MFLSWIRGPTGDGTSANLADSAWFQIFIPRFETLGRDCDGLSVLSGQDCRVNCVLHNRMHIARTENMTAATWGVNRAEARHRGSTSLRPLNFCNSNLINATKMLRPAKEH